MMMTCTPGLDMRQQAAGQYSTSPEHHPQPQITGKTSGAPGKGNRQIPRFQKLQKQGILLEPYTLRAQGIGSKMCGNNTFNNVIAVLQHATMFDKDQ